MRNADVKVSLMAEKRITVRGASVRYLEDGEGAPVLLLPSSSGRATEYQEVIPFLSERFHVYAIDYPGFGRSDPLPEIEGTEDLARFVRDWMEAVGLRQAHVVGFSMGGWVSLLLALAHPERVSRLVLIATSGGRLAGVPIVSPSGMSFKEILDRFYHQKEVRDRLARKKLTPEEREEVFRSSRALARLVERKKVIPELHHRLREIKHPTLVVGGDHDRAIPPVYQQRLQSGILSSRLVSLRETGHAVIAERPRELAAEILKFLDQNGQRH